MIKLVDAVNIIMLMETFKKVNGKTIKLTGMVFIFIQINPNISVTGRMVYKMGKV